jgi:uncharacterized protein (UPF0261 family)
VHNPTITSLLATPDELVKIGEYVADHVNKTTGPVAVLFPLLGLDKYMSPGSPWFGPEYLAPLFSTIRENLRKDIEIVELENHINDTDFADAVFNKFMELWAKK